MKKFIATVLILNSVIWFGLSSLAKADTKIETIIGHVITQKILGNDMDRSQVLDDELKMKLHQLTIEMTSVVLKNMPNILDTISAQLRLEADKHYKCSIQDKNYKNKDCI